MIGGTREKVFDDANFNQFLNDQFNDGEKTMIRPPMTWSYLPTDKEKFNGDVQPVIINAKANRRFYINTLKLRERKQKISLR